MTKKTNKYGEFIKEKANRERDFFFGEGNWKKVTNQYYSFKREIDSDNIIIFTKDIKMIKGSFVLIVDNNKGVYLKDWQVRKMESYREEVEGFVVKLNRKYFRPYTFNFTFEDMAFEKEDTFDSLVAIAKEQDCAGITLKFSKAY